MIDLDQLKIIKPWRANIRVVEIPCQACDQLRRVRQAKLRSGLDKGLCYPCSRKKRMADHPGSDQRLWSCWNGVVRRADGKQSPEIYFDRGIGVVKEWREFAAFESWALANGYDHHLTIDRIDNDKGYSPENCRWVTRSENSGHHRPAEFHNRKRSLTREQATAAHQMVFEGASDRTIAEHFKVTIGVVSALRHGKAYKWAVQ